MPTNDLVRRDEYGGNNGGGHEIGCITVVVPAQFLVISANPDWTSNGSTWLATVTPGQGGPRDRHACGPSTTAADSSGATTTRSGSRLSSRVHPREPRPGSPMRSTRAIAPHLDMTKTRSIQVDVSSGAPTPTYPVPTPTPTRLPRHRSRRPTEPDPDSQRRRPNRARPRHRCQPRSPRRPPSRRRGHRPRRPRGPVRRRPRGRHRHPSVLQRPPATRHRPQLRT